MQTNFMSGPGYLRRELENRPILKDLTEEQIEIVMESRLADLNSIRTITLYAIGPLVLLSFTGGYVIASLSLKPLEELTEKIEKKSMENLGNEIDFEDNGDEISQLIKSFNRMSRRLDKNFEEQKQFVENASHEIKTPLAIIQANLDTALEDGNLSKKEVKELLVDSKKNIKFMNTLTEDLLLLSILDQNIDMEKVNIVNIVKESIKQVEGISSKDIKFIEKYSNKNISVTANNVLLQRAIMNILENAVKYSECTKIRVQIYKEKNNVFLEIEDNGKGIDKKHLNKIFDRFYRVDKSRSRKTGGSGLGLAITKKIVNSINGEIKVESEKDIKTKFTIKIPI
jgi:signal transduction histidine kinase